MKNKAILFALQILVTAFFFSCTRELPMIEEEVPANTKESDIKYTGNFSSAGRYTTSGTASLIQTEKVRSLFLNNFMTSSGPDLFIYLSKDKSAKEFIILGELKSLSGSHNYDVAGEVNIEEYPFVLIWCKRFSALFGSAELTKKMP
jgi:hypothetical protein